MVGANDPGAKLDRRDVAFASRAQAEDETQFAVSEARLVRARHDRGVEEGCGFEGIFAGEKRANVELPRLGERPAAKYVGLDPLEVTAPHGPDVRMSAPELSEDGR